MASRWLTQRRVGVPECDASHNSVATLGSIRAPFIGPEVSSGRDAASHLGGGCTETAEAHGE
jgi:hypothetical protein